MTTGFLEAAVREVETGGARMLRVAEACRAAEHKDAGGVKRKEC